MKTGLTTRAVPLCLVAILAACEAAAPTQPRADVIPAVVAGDYNLVASGATTSGAWETFAYRYEGTLSLEQNQTDRSKLSGTFQDLVLTQADDLVPDQNLHGMIAGSVDAKGNVTLELTNQSGELEWTGRGIVADSQITGRWETKRSYEAAGGFSARLIPGS